MCTVQLLMASDSVRHDTVIKCHNENTATRNNMYNKLHPRGGSYQRHEQVSYVTQHIKNTRTDKGTEVVSFVRLRCKPHILTPSTVATAAVYSS